MENKPARVVYPSAVAAVAALFLLIWLYVREYAVFSNTIGVGRLVAVACIVGAILAGGLIYALRRRLTPWNRHWPEVFLLLFAGVLFAPLFGSLLNRAGGRTENQSFEFLAETPYLASRYGLLKGEAVQPTGYRLDVREQGQLRSFRYRTQAYFPNTKAGDPVLLPVRRGLFGVRVMMLR